ncbi:MAG: hypothetical protein AB1546_06525 [bacterium]
MVDGRSKMMFNRLPSSVFRLPFPIFHCWLLATIYWLLFAISANAEVVNLSEKNKIFLHEKVNALRQTELLRISRGRLQPNPIPLTLFTTYQTIITSQEFMIARHNQQFASTLARLRAIEAGTIVINQTTQNSHSKFVFEYFEKELHRLYLLENTLNDASTMLKIQKGLDRAIYGMESIPVRAELALSALMWLQNIFVKDIPQPVLENLSVIMKTEITAEDAFTMNEAINNISAEYARLINATIQQEEKK